MSKQPTLVQLIGTPPVRQRVIEEFVAVIDEQVKGKSVFLRTAYAAIKAIRKRFIADVVDALLDEWLMNIESHYQKWQSFGDGPLSEYFTARSEDIAIDLLAVTDLRAERTRHAAARKYYLKHRPKAQQYVSEAVPELARIVESHLAAREPAAPGQAPLGGTATPGPVS